MRAKAAEARSLIGFAHEVCQAYLKDENVKEHSIKMAAKELWHCYSFLAKDKFDSKLLLQHTRRFLLLCKGLEDPSTQTWKIKPKHHSFLELVLQGNPADSWTYRDEDFGGFLASLSAVKGGSHNPHSIGMSVLQTFRGQTIPELKS